MIWMQRSLFGAVDLNLDLNLKEKVIPGFDLDLSGLIVCGFYLDLGFLVWLTKVIGSQCQI